MPTLCVFCGSNSGASPEFLAAAKALGRILAEKQIGLIYGGSNVGLMGALADAVLAGGGVVTGVIPRGLVEREVAHQHLTNLRIVETMHERKAFMADRSDAFLALPGGFGTFDELCEIITWAQIGIHSKSIGLLNTLNYWDPFLRLVDHAIQSGFIHPSHRALLTVHDRPEGILGELFSPNGQRPPTPSKWINTDIR